MLGHLWTISATDMQVPFRGPSVIRQFCLLPSFCFRVDSVSAWEVQCVCSNHMHVQATFGTGMALLNMGYCHTQRLLSDPALIELSSC